MLVACLYNVADSLVVGCYCLRSRRGLRSNRGYVCGDALYQLYLEIGSGTSVKRYHVGSDSLL